MSKLKDNFSKAWSVLGTNFANPAATALGKNQADGTFLGDTNAKLSNPLGQVGPVGRDIIQKHNPPPAPALAPVVPMPDQEAIDAAARRSRARQLGRGGFASTILSAQSGAPTSSDRLGP